MSASSTCSALTVCNLALTSARCTGFTKVHGENDFIHVIDLEWTDERSVCIKRTFAEFQRFHNDLEKLFPELRNLKFNLKTSFRENLVSLFSKDKRAIAEKRELLLDQYLQQLLRQPERIRRCNSVLSFFDSRESDPKPCHSNAPSEKADSGIDLTGDSCSHHYFPSIQTMTEISAEGSSDETTNGNSKPLNTNNVEDFTDNEYDGDTSETEMDDDTYDEDYFLDVGYGELMLQPSSDAPSQVDCTEGTESSMWCSNLEKFSNILRTSMTNVNVPCENQLKTCGTLSSYNTSMNNILDEPLMEESDVREVSKTESYQSEDNCEAQYS
ncbi:uncharacterized protein [Watersipora subatra]|uniref:uncharacterized protein n=1 Tax=Watersipora subatra TaxID=2589382 RepID=UPI00355B8DEC